MGIWSSKKTVVITPKTTEKVKIAPTLNDIIEKSAIHHCVILDQVTNYYHFTRVLGTGHFGVVREATRKVGNSKMRYAIKSIPKENCQGDFMQLKRELEILFKLDHPNIIKQYEIYEDMKYIHMVTEACYGGPLFDKIIDEQGLPEAQAKEIFRQIWSAICHIHATTVVHRDLKPDNILFVNNEKNSEIKIIDFGLSQIYGRMKMHSAVGTPYYMPPEMLSGQYGKECDIWSAGVMLYAMLSAWFPFAADTHTQLFQLIKKGEFNITDDIWGKVSDKAKNLICQMIVVNPVERLTIQEVLKHPWFTSQSQANNKAEAKKLLPTISRLRNFHVPKRLKAEATRIMIQHMTADNYEDLRIMFRQLDTENTGFITAINLKRAMNMAGLDVAGEELMKIIERVDYLKTGKINYTTFLRATINLKEILSEHLVYDTFQRFDTKKLGYINQECLREALQRANVECTVQEITEMMNEYKFGKNGKIYFEHFKTIMMNDNTPGSRNSYPRKFDTFTMSPVGPERGDDFGSVAVHYIDKPPKPALIDIPPYAENSLFLSPKGADETNMTSRKSLDCPEGVKTRLPYRRNRDSQDHTHDFSQDFS